MPPKQVYGKRAKTTTANYSKFLSPDKDDDLQGKSGKKNGSTKEKESDVEIAEVERRLESLNLKDKKEKGKSLRKDGVLMSGAKVQDCQAQEGRTRRVAVRVEIDRRPESLTVQEDICVASEVEPKKRGRSRRALENGNANVGIKSSLESRGKHRARIRDHETKSKNKNANIENATPEATTDEETAKRESHERAVTPSRADIANVQKHATAPSTPLRSPKSKAKDVLSPHSTSMVCPNDIYSTHVHPLLALCDQRRIIPFEEWSSRLDACVDVEKIAEASFSEVYRLRVRNATPGSANESVLKIVALRMPPTAPLPGESIESERPRRKGDVARQLKKEREHREEEDRWKSRVEDVHCEVRLLQNLNHIPGFTNFRELMVLQGQPSASFGRAWKEWNKARPRGKKSEFPDPNKKGSYEDTQLWAVIEMQDAGTDCGKVIEASGISTIWEVWDVFWGVCLSVAKAEEGCRFEHRDLHMDNICIRSSTADWNLLDRVVRNPLKRKLGFTGLETTVIDYTLSRADIIKTSSPTDSHRASSSSSCSSVSTSSNDHEPEVAYLDLNKDKSLFEGDAEVEYQYEIYRYMHGSVFHNDPLQQPQNLPDTPEYTQDTPRRSPRKQDDTMPETPRRSPRKSYIPRIPAREIWKHYHPKTNLIWAHFILYSLLSNLQGNEPASLSEAEIMRNIDADPADGVRIHKKAIKLHKILDKVATFLEPEMLGPKSRLCSMSDLVILALEANWLSPTDVACGAALG